MKIDILSVFPKMFDSVMNASILSKASEKGLLEINTVDIRDFTKDKHKKTDETPFGGGAGMVMTVQPVFDALKSVGAEKKRILYMSPRGKMLDGKFAEELSREEALVFLCGHYEGIDERIIEYWKPEEISIGDYILTGGELAAMVVIDVMSRLIPDVLGNQDSVKGESVYSGLLEYPQYTRPREYEGLEVPDVLLSGDHKAINLWKFEQACILTKNRRADLWENFLKRTDSLSKDERKIIEKLR